MSIYDDILFHQSVKQFTLHGYGLGAEVERLERVYMKFLDFERAEESVGCSEGETGKGRTIDMQSYNEMSFG